MSPRSRRNVFSVACPDCLAPENKKCVWIVGEERRPDWGVIGRLRGRSHPNRYSVFYASEQARRQRRRWQLVNNAGADIQSAARAMEEFSRREYQQLHEWLLLNASVLTGYDVWPPLSSTHDTRTRQSTVELEI